YLLIHRTSLPLHAPSAPCDLRHQSENLQPLDGIIDAVLRLLRTQPRDEFCEAVSEIDLRAVTENASRSRNVGKTMPDIAGTVFASDLAGHVCPEHLRELGRDFANRNGLPRRYVERNAVGIGALDGQQVGLDDIAHIDEIPQLQTVLENQRRFPIHQAGSEDRDHPGVRIREGLASAIDVEVAQRHGWDLISSPKQ